MAVDNIVFKEGSSHTVQRRMGSKWAERGQNQVGSKYVHMYLKAFLKKT